MEKLNINCSGIESFVNQLIDAGLQGFRPAKEPKHFPFVTCNGQFFVELERSVEPVKRQKSD